MARPQLELQFFPEQGLLRLTQQQTELDEAASAADSPIASTHPGCHRGKCLGNPARTGQTRSGFYLSLSPFYKHFL